MDLNDLPDEMLCLIFDHLDVYELKIASLVCRRWSQLTFSGRRMDRVLLVKRDYNCEFLFKTKRNYRNVRLRMNDKIESLVRLLHTLKPNVRVLHIKSFVVFEQLRLLLLEAPELEHLEIETYLHFGNETNEPFPVLAKLKSLVLKDSAEEHINIFCRSMSNLQSLYMHCLTDFELEAWKHLSGQLKLIHLNEVDETYLTSFLELTFQILEEFVFVGDYYRGDLREMILNTNNDFFRRHPFLRRLSLPMYISVQWVESIGHHCPELTHLDLLLDDPEEGYLEPLMQLTKLKHLSLEGIAERKMFRKAFKLLKSVALQVARPRVLLENLFEVAPRLNRLKISCGQHDLLQLQFICENFSYLQHLEVNVEKVTAADNSVRFDRLAHLRELTFVGLSNIRYIHRNNVRCLTMRHSSDDELELIPEKFPLLKRLFLEKRPASLGAVKWLQKLMPSCRIDCGNKRFYPVDDGTSK